ncbi:Uncharacterised protein [Enterococcus malodoratus]|uniref:Uncharacterized protein n=1 Tax=Enterococcus malodoratus ATCC 43197 TaxID=1158601 RepID=R2RI92_9ENTE|nr:hypothetical protein UAI_02733 [Enterococcus malodoratus ATCC 43197]EOT67551.1 hypothetical protein I585_03072 [Enterococcus malodoratus ATCC 43197]SPX03427.1 Uncharacterised protein [Enterococcus malodoratus]STD69197.1 Uncharacterised protein [Enterococcus malodoratus]
MDIFNFETTGIYLYQLRKRQSIYKFKDRQLIVFLGLKIVLYYCKP